MKIIYYDELNILIDKVIKENNCSKIILLKNGKFIKIFDINWIIKSFTYFSNIEARIKKYDELNFDKDIVKIEGLIYYRDNIEEYFIGYMMDKANGLAIDEYLRRLKILKRDDISIYNNIYLKLENIVKKYQYIVFPDIISKGNIFIDPVKNNLQLLDYDGFQVQMMKSGVISSFISKDMVSWDNSKYICNYSNNIYTKNLDIRSIIMLYFYYMFNIDLFICNTYIDNNYKLVSKKISLDELFNLINLNNEDIMNKVWLLFKMDKDMPNEYLDINSLRELEEKYILKKVPSEYGYKGYIRKLELKR